MILQAVLTRIAWLVLFRVDSEENEDNAVQYNNYRAEFSLKAGDMFVNCDLSRN